MGSSVKGEVVTEFKVTGVENVRRGLKQVQDEGGRMATRLGGAARTAASGLEQISRTGKASGDAVKTIVSQGANMAFMFGAGGPIVGALAIGGLAMFNFFDRARKEMEETRRKFQTEIASIARSGDLTRATQRAQALFSGDAFATLEGQHEDESDAQFLGRRGGIQALQQEIARLEASRKAAEAAVIKRHEGVNGPFPTAEINSATRAQRQQLEQLRPLLAQYIEQHKTAITVVEQLSAAETDRATLGIRMGQEGAAAKAIEKEIAGLTALQKMNALRKDDIERARQIESALTSELLHGNVTRERRIVLEKQLRELSVVAGIGRQTMAGQQLDAARVLGKRATTPIIDQVLPARGPFKIPGPSPEQVSKQLAERAKKGMSETMRRFQAQVGEQVKMFDTLGEELQSAANNFGLTVGGAISDAFAVAFSGEGAAAGFKAFSAAVLSGFGTMLQQQGQIYLQYGLVMKKLVPSLFNPVTSGGSAIAIGVALLAMGGALQGLMHGKGAGAGSGGFSTGAFVSSPAQIIDRGLVNPANGVVNRAGLIEPRKNVTVNLTVIGPDDPNAQRAVVQLIENAGRR